MERMKKKIQSQSGASFLFALLAFLVAAMVSVTIVSAAVTTVKRVNSDRDAQQAQLTLISAARLVRDEMEKTRYVITTKETTTTTTGENGEEITITETTIDKSAVGTFKAEMQAAVEHVDTYSIPYSNPGSKAFTIQTADLDNIKTVDVSFDMKAEEGEKYHLVFTLWIDGTEETLFLKMSSPGIKYVGTVVEGNTKTITDEICWENGVINGIGDTDDSET